MLSQPCGIGIGMGVWWKECDLFPSSPSHRSRDVLKPEIDGDAAMTGVGSSSRWKQISLQKNKRV